LTASLISTLYLAGLIAAKEVGFIEASVMAIEYVLDAETIDQLVAK
jgi:hypothetical protein